MLGCHIGMKVSNNVVQRQRVAHDFVLVENGHQRRLGTVVVGQTLQHPVKRRTVQVVVFERVNVLLLADARNHAAVNVLFHHLQMVHESRDQIRFETRLHFHANTRQIGSRIGGHHGIGHTAKLHIDTRQKSFKRVVVKKTIAVQQRHFNVDTRQQLANRSNLVQPVLARLASMVVHVFGGKVGFELADSALSVFHGTALANSVEHEVSKAVQNLRNQHKLAGIKLNHARVAQHLGTANDNLERQHTVLLLVPSVAQSRLQRLNVLDVISLRHFELTVLVVFGALQFVQTPLRRVHRHVDAVRHVLHKGDKNAHCFVGCVLLQHGSLLAAPRHKTLLNHLVHGRLIAARLGRNCTLHNGRTGSKRSVGQTRLGSVVAVAARATTTSSSSSSTRDTQRVKSNGAALHHAQRIKHDSSSSALVQHAQRIRNNL